MASSSDFKSLIRPKNSDEFFVNLLPRFERESDFGWAVKSRSFPVYKLNSQRTPSEIVEAVLKSARVQEAVDSEMVDKKWPRNAAEMAAREIATEMGHAFHLKTVRAVGLGVHKVVQRIFSGLYVNPGRVAEARKMCSDSPLILLPTHRTYMDFLLISYICYELEFPLPAIAAGMDFFHMKVVGELLRRCGAFFIRRSFGNDQLYWAIFTEYVQTHIANGDQPMEFFLEGTRSRSGKSLHPKVGLLSTVLEPFFRRQVYDIVLLPISMSYGKILEETLYSYELLGFPKPKESTSGLMKARTILDSNFGDIFVDFCEPISVRKYVGDRLVKESHSLRPGFRFEMSEPELFEVKKLASHVLKTHQEHAVVSLWSLASLCLNVMLVQHGLNPRGSVSEVSYDSFCELTNELLDLTEGMGYRISLHMGSVRDDLRYFCGIHSNLVTVAMDESPRILRLNPVSTSAVNTESGNLPGALIDVAVPRMMLNSYGNNAMHMYANTGFVAISFHNADSIVGHNFLRTNLLFLQKLFAREFITVADEEESDLEEALERLIAAEVIKRETEETARLLNPKKAHMLASFLKPFLSVYWNVCDTVCHQNADALMEKPLIDSVQRGIAEKISCGTIAPMYQMLSTDTLKNAVHCLTDRGGLIKGKELDVGHTLVPNVAVVREIQGKIESFVAKQEFGSRKPIKAKL